MDLPPLVPRPPLARWMFDRDITLRDGAHYFDTSYETLRRACLPFGHPQSRPPYPGLMRRIIALTGGEVEPGDWYPVIDRAAA